MAAPWEDHLARWHAAGVVDDATAQRIRAYEAAEVRPAGQQQWQVLLALILGGLLLGAGVLLFVAAHWDAVSPGSRLALVMGMLAALHLGAILASEHFAGLATTLHGVGTVACGAAIAMVGQIFNMQEHWPSAVLLWAFCAAVAYWQLRDQFQQICLLLLGPAWFLCEWGYRASFYQGGQIYIARVAMVLAVVYLTAFVHSRKKVVFGVLFGFAAIGLLVATVELADGWGGYAGTAALPLSVGLRCWAIVLMLVLIAAGSVLKKNSVIPSFAAFGVAFALPWLQAVIHEHNEFSHQDWTHTVPNLGAYALVAGFTLLLCWWGMRERSRSLVNYGIAMFALVVAWFYSSSLMDKLGRSLGLIGLGVVFLAGGWLLEKLRRRLLLQMQEVRA